MEKKKWREYVEMRISTKFDTIVLQKNEKKLVLQCKRFEI